MFSRRFISCYYEMSFLLGCFCHISGGKGRYLYLRDRSMWTMCCAY